MRMTFFAALAAFMILTLTGCGSDSSSDSGPTLFVATILSDPYYDGDIQQDLDFGLVTDINQGVNTQQRLFAGLDPILPLEYRSFLDFHLTEVPENAIIDSAELDIFINRVDTQFPNDTIPLRVDLVNFQPPNLIGSDFDRPALATTLVNPPISQADFGRHVTIDVTALMIEAQRLGLVDFQVRIMEDLGFVAPGLIEINDTTTYAPQLTVYYY